MTKVLKGGNIGEPYLQLQTFISMIILGYFGVKIVFGLFFNFYPEKFYYRNIETARRIIIPSPKSRMIYFSLKSCIFSSWIFISLECLFFE